MNKFLKVLWVIMGVLIIVGGVAFFFNPLSAFVITEVIVGSILMCVGVISIIAYATTQKVMLGAGWVLAEGILSLLIGFLICFSGKSEAIFAITISMALGLWLLFSGISQISRSMDLHKLGAKGWGWITAWGIICVLAALSFFCTPIASAIGTVGYLSGFVMIIGGIGVITRCLARDIEE